MSLRLIAFPVLLMVLTVPGYSQSVYPTSSNFNSIRQNGVSTMEASGDTVWISPILNYNIANVSDWFFPADILNVLNDEGRVFSIAIDGPRIIAGLGSTPLISGQSVATGFGYYLTQNAGQDWTFIEFPTDDTPPGSCDDSVIPYDGSCDIPFIYGDSTYYRIRNSVPQQSPPYSVSASGSVIFSANWASGLLRSTDSGSSWDRIILPPQSADSLSPDSSYIWRSVYNGALINRYDARADLNLLGFSTMIDRDGNTWFGSANGVNISPDALTAANDQIRWKHVQFDSSSTGLLSNWVIDIEQDSTTGKVWLTNWIIDSSQGEQFGIVSTNDQGNSFQQHLIGERINDISFFNGAVVAVGNSGVFISEDDGLTWNQITQISSPNGFISEGSNYFSAASTSDRLWIGTSDGIASSSDLGASWAITRVNFPLQGGNVFEPETRDVEAYAYPNPFSPDIHGQARIKFEVTKPGNVQIRIFDFGMNLIREITNQSYPAGTYEAVWDGFTTHGSMVANAPYFYVIDMNGTTINGKILVVR